MVQIERKSCVRCEVSRDVDEYAEGRKLCKVCRSADQLASRRTMDGMIGVIYRSMVVTSKDRGFEPVAFSLDELRYWFSSRKNAGALYDRWVGNNYSKKTKPSVFRRDYQKPYTIDNLVLMSLAANHERSAKNYLVDRSIPVVQYSLDGDFIAEFGSSKLASESLEKANGSITRCCNGNRISAYGFHWRYLNER